MESTLRKRNVGSQAPAEDGDGGLSIGETIKQLDLFPKVMPTYKETSSSGGTATILTFGLILFLVLSELSMFQTQKVSFQFGVDPQVDDKLELNFDIAVATKCEHISTDILESTGEATEGFAHQANEDDGKNDHGHDEIREQPIAFDLSPDQRSWWSGQYRKPVDEFLSLTDFRMKTRGKADTMPASSSAEMNGCRVQGSLKLNKIAGNFHILAGQSFNSIMGHAHNVLDIPSTALNFSHRISHLSFGHEMPGMVFPMNGDEEIADSNNFMYQYFIQVVPTAYILADGEAPVRTAQFSVTRQARDLNVKRGSYRHPGIFFKYEIFPILVTVKYEHSSFWHFLIRLCGIIGGVFTTTGVVHELVRLAFEAVARRVHGKAAGAVEGGIVY